MRAHVASSRRVEHPWRKGFLINVAACAGETCGWIAPNEDVDHTEHVAAEIDTALGGLTPWTATEGDATRSAWVSGWTEVNR